MSKIYFYHLTRFIKNDLTFARNTKLSRFCVLLIGIFMHLNLENSAIAVDKQELFFACEKGYLFESKKQSARCIKKMRLSHRPPNPCSKKKGYTLSIDEIDLQDFCIVDKKKHTDSLKSKPLLPTCSNGFRLSIRRGKDSCVQKQKENIKPPSKKVRL